MRVSTSLLAASTAALLGLSAAAQAVPVTGLAGSLSRGTLLFSFDTATPGTASALRSITGLQTGEGVLGIDYRPANGVLYGLTDANRLYTINAGTGVATLASTLTGATLSSGAIRFDVAFNPTVDRLRVVGDDGQNLRIDVDTGAVTVDTRLAYAAGDPNAGGSPSVAAVAYTNQFAGAGSTTLYDLDSGIGGGVLAIQNPPNNGTLNTVGPLGVSSLVSFDIDALTGTAYAASAASFYQVNLATGAASLIGTLGVNSSTTGFNTSDFALVPTAVPEPMSLALLGTGLAGLGMVRRCRKSM